MTKSDRNIVTNAETAIVLQQRGKSLGAWGGTRNNHIARANTTDTHDKSHGSLGPAGHNSVELVSGQLKQRSGEWSTDETTGVP